MSISSLQTVSFFEPTDTHLEQHKENQSNQTLTSPHENSNSYQTQQDYQNLLKTLSYNHTQYDSFLSKLTAPQNIETVKTPTTNTYEMQADLYIKDRKKLPRVEEFESAIFHATSYPEKGKFLGFNVSLFQNTQTLKNRQHRDDYSVVYQVTSGNKLFGVSPRHFILVLQVQERSQDSVEITWNLLKNEKNNNRFTGPYSQVLNNASSENIYTPFNSGRWSYNRNLGKVEYDVMFDNGTSFTNYNLTNKSLLLLPLALLEEKWGIKDVQINVDGKMYQGK